VQPSFSVDTNLSTSKAYMFRVEVIQWLADWHMSYLVVIPGISELRLTCLRIHSQKEEPYEDPEQILVARHAHASRVKESIVVPRRLLVSHD
jgi:hypothetical protein